MNKIVHVLGVVLAICMIVGPVIAQESGPVLSHVCTPEGETQLEAEVVWPGAPADAVGTAGELEIIDSTGITQTVSLAFDRFTGPVAHFPGTIVITPTVPYTITSGWVYTTTQQVSNLPVEVTSTEGELNCSPTAITLGNTSASVAETPVGYLPLYLLGILLLAVTGFVLSPWGRRFINSIR